jgi:hypothetical protein
MASQVLSGSGNLSYINTTGNTVRVIIYSVCFSTPSQLTVSWGASGSPATISLSNVRSLGKNLASIDGSQKSSITTGGGVFSNKETTTTTYTTTSDNLYVDYGTISSTSHLYVYSSSPTEIFLNPNEIFTLNSPSNISGYNVLVVPENG